MLESSIILMPLPRVLLATLISLLLHTSAFLMLRTPPGPGPDQRRSPFHVGVVSGESHSVPAPKSKFSRPAEKQVSEVKPGATLHAEATWIAASRPGAELAAGIQNQYLSELTQWIETRKIYPIAARRLGQEGQVEIAFTIQKDGSIRDAQLTQPCAADRLNEAAFALAKGLDHFKPLPNEMRIEQWKLRLPISYRLQR